MRLVAVADTHTFEADLGPVPEGDLFIHAGDLVRAGTLEELEPVAAWIRALPHRHKIVVAGNHDWCFVRERERAIELLGPSVHYLQDGGVELEGVRFYGSPWQPAYNDWAFNLARGEELAERWALIPERVDVLITHVPPEGIGDAGPVGGRHGCEELKRAIGRVRPRVHCFGHIHTDGGAWKVDETLHANVTTWECERAATVIDLPPRGPAIAHIIPPRGR